MTIAWAKAVKELSSSFPLPVLLKKAKLPKATFYWAIARMDEDPDADIKAKILEVFKENKGRYGVRRVCIALNDEEGHYKIKISHGRVQRLMHEMGLMGPRKKGKYKSFKGKIGKIAPNIVDRQFDVDHPNQVWGTDVSEFSVPSWGKAYFSPIVDFCDGTIVAYDFSRHPDFAQTMRMLRSAVKTQPLTAGIVLHSDQGWQYQMKPYQSFLEEYGMIQSMSRKGNCLDNAKTENLFGRMKVEMFYGHEMEFDSFEKLKAAVDEYVRWYNSERIKLRLKMSPEQFRRHIASEFVI